MTLARSGWAARASTSAAPRLGGGRDGAAGDRLAAFDGRVRGGHERREQSGVRSRRLRAASLMASNASKLTASVSGSADASRSRA